MTTRAPRLIHQPRHPNLTPGLPVDTEVAFYESTVTCLDGMMTLGGNLTVSVITVDGQRFIVPADDLALVAA